MNPPHPIDSTTAHPPAHTGRRLVPVRAYARVAEVTAILVSTDDFDTFRIHVMNHLRRLDPSERSLAEDLVRLVWQRREVLVSEVNPVLRATTDLPPTPAEAIAEARQKGTRSGREELEHEVAAEAERDRAVAAALLAAPGWIEASARRDPPWGRELARAVRELDDTRTTLCWFLDIHRTVMQQHERLFGSGPT